MRRVRVVIQWDADSGSFRPFTPSGDRIPVFWGLMYGNTPAAQLGIGDDPGESIKTFTDPTLVADANGVEHMADPSPAKGAKLMGWVWVADG